MISPDFQRTLCNFEKVNSNWRMWTDKLILRAYVDRELLENADLQAPDISKLHIPLLVRDLLRRGIIKSKERAAVANHWRKDF